MSELPSQKIEREITPDELAKRVSFFMTKPENTDTNAPLLLFLKNKGLNAKVFRKVLDEGTISKLYTDINYAKVTSDHMLGKEVEVFLVTKDDENTSSASVLNEVLELVGNKTKPEENSVGTLRKHFHGKTISFDTPSHKNLLYTENGFHKPSTSKELVDHLEILGLLDEAKRLALE